MSPRATKQSSVNRPDTPHPAHARMAGRWRRCRDLLGGTDVIHAAGERYIQKYASETQDDYDSRLERCAVYNAFAQTVRACTGLVFHQNPELSEDVPQRIREDWENLDGEGTHADVLLRQNFSDALGVGLGGWLVEMPKIANPERVTLEDEQRLQIRAYWVWYSAEDVISWSWMREGGAKILSRLVLRECVEKEDPDGFAIMEVEQFRVLRLTVLKDGDAEDAPTVRLVKWEVWEEKVVEGGKVKSFAITDQGFYSNQAEIPFSPVLMGDDLGPMETKPPLLDLADLNLEHHKVNTELHDYYHHCCTPVPVRKGYKDPAGQDPSSRPRMKIGPTRLQDLPADGEFSWAELEGTSLETLQAELRQKEQRMASLGLSFLANETRAAETAQAKQIDATVQNANLVACARAFSDAAERAMTFHARFYDPTAPSGGSLGLNRNFELMVLDPTLMAALSALEEKGQLTLRTIWHAMRTGKLPEDFDPEKERRELLAAGARDVDKAKDVDDPEREEERGAA